jgi:uncharacterized OB-fold protein
LSVTSGDPRPRPAADDTSAFFWDAAREGRLLVQRCASCRLFQYPPDVACVHCQSTDLAPTEVSGRGSLYSFAVVDRAFHAGFVESLPYVVARVERDEQPGLRLLTNIVDAAPGSLLVGQELIVTFEVRDDVVLPQFRPAGATP